MKRLAQTSEDWIYSCLLELAYDVHKKAEQQKAHAKCEAKQKASETHHEETLGVLGEFCRSHGYQIDWNVRDDKGKTPFQAACSHQYWADDYNAVKFFSESIQKSIH